MKIEKKRIRPSYLLASAQFKVHGQNVCWYFATSRIEIRKRTDTAVAFTQEYSKISYPQRNVRTLSTGSGSSKDTHLCRIGGMRGFPKVQNLSLVKI